MYAVVYNLCVYILYIYFISEMQRGKLPSGQVSVYRECIYFLLIHMLDTFVTFWQLWTSFDQLSLPVWLSLCAVSLSVFSLSLSLSLRPSPCLSWACLSLALPVCLQPLSLSLPLSPCLSLASVFLPAVCLSVSPLLCSSLSSACLSLSPTVSLSVFSLSLSFSLPAVCLSVSPLLCPSLSSACLWLCPQVFRLLLSDIKGYPKRRRKLAWKCRKRTNILVCLLWAFVVLIFMEQKYVYLSSSGCSHVGSLIANEEQIKVGSWHSWHFCHMSALFMTSHTQNDSTHGSVVATFKYWFNKLAHKLTDVTVFDFKSPSCPWGPWCSSLGVPFKR